MSEVYEVGRGSKTKDRPRTEEGKLKPKDATLASLSEDDVLTKTANDISEWFWLSEVYENPTGADHKSKEYQDAKVASGSEDDVLTKTAKDIHKRVGVNIINPRRVI